MHTSPLLKTPVTLYLAEDHVFLRDLISAEFKDSSDYQVVGTTSSGASACTEVPALKPDMVLLSIELPDMTGIDVAHRIREVAPNTRLLMFTAADQPHLLQAAISAKVDGIVRKAAPLPTLLDALHTVASGKTYYDETLVQDLQAWSKEKKVAMTDLTTREQEVFRLVVSGRSNKEVGTTLGISVKTAEHHRKNLMLKLGAKNTADLTREAFRLGVLR